LLVQGTANAAVPAKEYDCSDARGDAVSMIIGDGRVEYWVKADRWSGNLCDASSKCAFDGAIFEGAGEYFDLYFDSSTGSMRFDAMGIEPF
jgi:hypothetical protein